jgi:hypothetical protein
MSMNSYLKPITGIVALATISQSLFAADVPTYPTYTPSTSSPPTYSPTYSASNSIATSSSNAVVLALNAQALLLREIEQEHQKKAADLTQKNETEKAKWESDLVNELHEKSVRLQKSIDQTTQPSLGSNDLKGAGDVDDKLIFVSAVEARLQELQQELSATIEDGRALTTQMGTNKVPEDIANLSLTLSENQKVVKQLQREQLDLELRKLEFRAVFKAMQK